MKIFIKKVLFPTLIFITTFLLFLHYFNSDTKNNVTDSYQLKAYKNSVALYNGEKIIKIYDTIVLNTLPQKDIYDFKSGIVVASPEQAEELIEDYDS